MLLTDAIKLGSLLHPQGFGERKGMQRNGFLGLFGRAETVTCALGAAYEAAGCQVIPSYGSKGVTERGITVAANIAIGIDPAWYRLLFRSAPQKCPACRNREVENVARLIAHLNDKHRWKRERIAEYLAQEGLDADSREADLPFFNADASLNALEEVPR